MDSVPRQQTYIAKVRYKNDLPPPPAAPKMLAIPLSLDSYTSSEFMSQLIREQPVDMQLNAELGMALDLTRFPGVFQGDNADIHPHVEPRAMHPKDKALLKDPAAKYLQHSTSVNFLRRTEYLSSESATRAGRTTPQRARTASNFDHKLTLPENQLCIIEAGFQAVSEPLDRLSHPDNKHLSAVEAWEFLPDLNLAGQDLLLARFAEDPTTRNVNDKVDESLQTELDLHLNLALLRPTNNSDETEHWLVYYLPNLDRSKKIFKRLESNQAQVDMPEADDVFRYSKVRDYNFSLANDKSNTFSDLLVCFRDSEDNPDQLKKAFYTPMTAKTMLKRKRAINKYQNVEEEVTEIDLRFQRMEPADEDVEVQIKDDSIGSAR